MSANILTLEEARKAKYKELKNSEEDSHLADKLKDLEADFDKGKEKLDEGDEYWNSYWKEYRESVLPFPLILKYRGSIINSLIWTERQLIIL